MEMNGEIHIANINEINKIIGQYIFLNLFAFICLSWSCGEVVVYGDDGEGAESQ